MSLLLSLTVIDHTQNIVATYVRDVSKDNLDTKIPAEFLDFASNFLCAKEHYFRIVEFQPFAKWAKLSYDDGSTYENSVTRPQTILITWEHMQ